MITFEIYSIYEEDFNGRLESFNRRATKNGLPEFTAMIERYRDEDGRLVSIVSMNDTLPQFSGWSILAVMDFVARDDITETLTRVLPGKSLPVEFEKGDSKRCDHCNVRHSRVQAIVIQHTDGRVMQVGKSCMTDFLGKDADTLISLMWLVDFDGELKGMRGGSRKEAIDLVNYLHSVRRAIRAYGWVSRTKAQENHTQSTADVAWNIMYDKDSRKAAIEAIKINNRPVAYKITEALDWAIQQSGNEYLDTIATIARLDIVPRKYDGFAASILASYEYHLAKEAEKALEQKTAKPATNGRQSVTGTILSIKEKYSQYGVVFKMLLKTVEGWKLYCTLPRSLKDAKIGDAINLTVTVKPSSDDNFFAFGSRPTKATVL
jgi:hypothetical protein